MIGPAIHAVRKAVFTGKILDHFAVEGIWGAILSSTALFFWGLPVAEFTLYVFLLLWLAYRKENVAWGTLLSFSVFLFLGWYAAHRFEPGKIADWGTWTLLPFFTLACLINFPRFGAISRALVLTRLHWFPFSVLVANLSVWISWRWLSFSWGIVLLILLIWFTNLDRRTRFLSGFTAVSLYTMIIHMFQWRGIVTLGTEPHSFFENYWHTLAIPYLALAIIMERGKKL